VPVKVHVSSHIRAYTGGQGQIDAEGSTLEQILGSLDARYPGIRFRLVDEQGRLRPHVNFFVGGVLVRDPASPVAPGDDVHILGALSGG
jgi:molybdopterin converting factor small subunit